MEQEKRSDILNRAWQRELECAQRKPHLFKQCLYIPDRYRGPLEDHQLIWNKKRPLAIEYCSGNGQWIVEAAKHRSEYNWIAVEKDFQRARKIWKKIQREEMDNLFLVFGEAYFWTTQWVQEASIQEVWVNFPDPWPKRRHGKNRLIQEPFEREMARILKKGAVLTLVTDDSTYSNQMQRVFQNWNRSDEQLVFYGQSYFHALWTALGKKIDYHRFKNA